MSNSPHDIISPPIFSSNDLPPLSHLPVEETEVSQWTSERVDELVSSVSVSLQCWLREMEQLLLLKRLLIQSRCDENEIVEKWYDSEINNLKVE